MINTIGFKIVCLRFNGLYQFAGTTRRSVLLKSHSNSCISNSSCCHGDNMALVLVESIQFKWICIALLTMDEALQNINRVSTPCWWKKCFVFICVTHQPPWPSWRPACSAFNLHITLSLRLSNTLIWYGLVLFSIESVFCFVWIRARLSPHRMTSSPQPSSPPSPVYRLPITENPREFSCNNYFCF